MPSHVDLSVLWVPIMPETSKLGEQMEQVGKDATESFGKGSSSLGDKIHESVTKSRDKIKDVFHRTGSDAGKSMSDAFKEETKAVEDIAGDAGEKASSKFRDTAKGLGKQLVDAIGPDTKKLLGDRLEEVVGDSLEGVLGDNAKWVGKFSHTVADWGFEELKTKLGGVKDAATDTKKAFASFKDGDTLGGVSTLLSTVDKLGIGVKDLPEPLRTVIGDISDAKSTAEEFAGIFKDLPGRIGAVGSAIENLAGPIGVAAAAAMAIWNGLPGIGGGLNEIIHSTDPSRGFVPPASQDIQQTPASQMPLPGMPQPVSAASIPAAGLAPGVQYTATQGSLDPFAALLPPGMAPPDLSKPSPIAPIDMPDGANPHPFVTPLPKPAPPPPPLPAPAASSPQPTPSSFVGNMPSSVSSPADLRAGGSRIANLYAVAQSLEGTPYSQALRNDCSGMVSKLATAALGMAPSAQFSTVNEGEWLMSHGFQPGIGPPGSLQIGWYDHGGGNAGHTAATLPNGMNAESGGGHGDFRVGAGAAGANDPQFTQHAWLPMDGSGQKSPLGSQNDPLFVSAAEKGGGAGGGSPWESEGQQLGQGLLGGIAQSVGLDGSVFKTFSGASNPMDFGITKIGTGLLNWGAGMLGAVHQKNTQTPHISNPTYNVDQSFNLTQHGVQGNGETPYKAAMNSSNRTAALAANMPGR